MADKFVGKRTDIASSGAVAGDVIYLVDQGEVWDAVNTKLSLPGFGCIKISSGVWAVLNQVKSLNFGLTKPPTHATTYKYSKGSIVVKDGDAYLANDDVPANTTFSIGATGATWKALTTAGTAGTAGTEFNDGNNAEAAHATSGAFLNVVYSDAFKVKEKMQIVAFEFKCITARSDAKVALVTSLSSDRKIKKMSNTVTMAITASTMHRVTISPVIADVGDYVGMVGYGGASGEMAAVAPMLGLPIGTTCDNWYQATASANPNIFVPGYVMTDKQQTAGWSLAMRYYYNKI